MKKLNWKKRYLNDKSGHWFSAYVKPLNWEYVVETGYCSDRYYCFLFVNKYSDEVKISKKTFKLKAIIFMKKLCCNAFLMTISY